MNGFVTGVVGALVEAWAQLRIGKLRVMLSLIGVAVAVAAMTFIIAFGQVSSAVQQDLMEKWAGRPGTVQIMVSPATGTQDGSSGVLDADAAAGLEDPAQDTGTDTKARLAAARTDFVSRYEITRWATSYSQNLRLSLADGPAAVSTTVVSPGYGLLHPTQLAEGRWFRAEDADDLSPSIVVSRSLLTQLGIDSLTEPVQVTGLAPMKATYTVVGVLPADPDGGQFCTKGEDREMVCREELKAFVLAEPFERLLPATVQPEEPTFEVWAGAGRSKEMTALAKTYFDGVFGRGATNVYDNDFGQSEDFNRVFTLSVTGAGVFIMVLGALGLINISLVTVRQRIHEIGVRRSFGATNRRIFFSIMLESVVATVVAGVVGIIIAIIAMRVIPLETLMQTEITNRPPFPMSAAFIGLAAASGVGALAGIIPAIVAVRIRPIDAIRI
ncbi:MAG: ABC transporter permease [Actinomyces urogenitalis]|uniref:Efflux ABC transporter, permease protein n=5 Tax=root TaxID=1 RepID=C0W6V0_9ACTO|nr:ABC transporter permease [Actinomyces urogenitalis]EEH65624.1 efflux ABC transporter, permease protein [Actinomyces urogenitalis DSM 15434]MBS5976673.1 ABC transporter permease [Actinomyces urogenitalis]MDK8237820.1 ABC transporter permease [Actinomyces urogenitalis]MDU0864022.1 ABC transporter permease [Actinomyces urogenitalis]MDU0874487.1 ABC transporter permease [Actinomyces urogenitalis]